MDPNLIADGVAGELTVAPFGPLPEAVVARVVIGPDDVDEPVGWGQLHSSEREFASTRPPRSRSEFVAGRRALRAALRQAGWLGSAPCLRGPQGRPVVPADFTASLTHKAGLALAIAAPTSGAWTLGIDCEVEGDRERSAIARKVLRPSELQRWNADGSRWPALLEVFSTKEAIYKALHPHVGRYIGFEEAEILADGQIQMHLSQQEGPFELNSHASWHGKRLLVVVEARLG